MPEASIAFIGGSGLYDMDGLTGAREVELDTPFGKPSDAITIGRLEGAMVAFLPRHGRGHRIMPTEIPARANIYALKTLGVERVVSISAVGSLKEEMKPLDLVVPDQIIDRTRERPATFFGEGLVAHVGFADPFCPTLRRVVVESAASLTDVHDGGIYVVMEGPQFSTRAESEMHRGWDASVIGMTALPEAKLAREAEMCYATLAFVTDYDVWHVSEDDVSVELVIRNLMRNVSVGQTIARRMAAWAAGARADDSGDRGDCGCGRALENAIITSPDSIPAATRERLAPLVDKYLGANNANTGTG